MDSLINDELQTIVADGAFRKNVSFVSFEQNKDFKATDQFMSTVIFGTILTSDGSKYSVVIKLKLRDEKFSIDSDKLFQNEIIMYERFIPLGIASRDAFGSDVDMPSIARYFYGQNKCGQFKEKDLIILENVNTLGYRLCEERLFLDYNHLVSALEAVAK